jgi:hypothetical protein
MSRKTLQPVQVLLQIGRELEQHGPILPPSAVVFAAEIHSALTVRLESGEVRDALAGLDREGERPAPATPTPAGRSRFGSL